MTGKPGRGRPPMLRGKPHRLSIYVGDDERKALAQICKKTGEGMSEAVRRLILRAARRLK